jgi:hypothetical protein
MWILGMKPKRLEGPLGRRAVRKEKETEDKSDGFDHESNLVRTIGNRPAPRQMA